VHDVLLLCLFKTTVLYRLFQTISFFKQLLVFDGLINFWLFNSNSILMNTFQISSKIKLQSKIEFEFCNYVV